jgi:hypothetical protein
LYCIASTIHYHWHDLQDLLDVKDIKKKYRQGFYNRTVQDSRDTYNMANTGLTNQDFLDDADRSKLRQECECIGSCLGKCFISATTAYRLRKISKLSESSLNENVDHMKIEIGELIGILTNLVSWRCGVCDKTVDAEHESQLKLWVEAHEMGNDHKRNLMQTVKRI